MLRWLCFALLLAIATPSQAQVTKDDTKATLGKLPEVYVLTALKSGNWDDFDELAAEALDEVDDAAGDRDIELVKTEVVIFELFGLKDFRARIGYLLAPEAKAKPGRYGKNIELRLLKGAAYVSSGVGGATAAPPLRRAVLEELEKPGAKRLKGIETIELYYGDMDGNDTKVEVYGPLR